MLNKFLIVFCKLKLFYYSKKREIHFGKSCRIDLKTRIDTRRNKLKIGNDVYLRSNPKGYHAGMPFPTSILIDKEGATVEIGDNCRINGAYIHAQKSIVIGKNTVIASGTQIIDSNGHNTQSINRTKERDNAVEIVIGDNVWIGLNVVILKGTKIGSNSVVGANSVVKGFFPKNSLIVGNPASIVKTLELL